MNNKRGSMARTQENHMSLVWMERRVVLACSVFSQTYLCIKGSIHKNSKFPLISNTDRSELSCCWSYLGLLAEWAVAQNYYRYSTAKVTSCGRGATICGWGATGCSYFVNCVLITTFGLPSENAKDELCYGIALELVFCSGNNVCNVAVYVLGSGSLRGFCCEMCCGWYIALAEELISPLCFKLERTVFVVVDAICVICWY